MTDEIKEFEKLSDGIEDRFNLLAVVAGTLTAQAFSAVEIHSQREVTLWRTRGPLAQAEVERFKNRLVQMQRVPGVMPILSSGVDVFNRGFAVLPAYEGRPIHCPAMTSTELEERYKACVSIIEELHARCIVCGDLCLESFSVNDRGKVSLFAVLGDVVLESEAEEFNRTQYIAFRPPEQKSGEVDDPSVDVYALAWIGEGLFAAAGRMDQRAHHTSPPLWLKNVLRETSSEVLRQKMNTASSLRLLVESHGDDNHETTGHNFALMEILDKKDGNAGERREHDAASDVANFTEMSGKTEGAENPEHEDALGAKRGRFDSGRNSAQGEGATAAIREALHLFRIPNRLLILLMLNLAALGVLLFLYMDSQDSALQLDRERATANVLVDNEHVQLKKWYASDEPAVHAEIVKQFEDTTSPEKRTRALRALIFRSRRLGLSRSADVALRFYDRAAAKQDPNVQATSLLVVRVLDPNMSQNERLERLAKLYDLDPPFASVLTASLVLDTGEAEPFRGILARAVSDQAGIPNGGEHSPFALILLIPQAHDLFSEDLVEINDRIPSADISWLLEELGRKGQPEVSTVAQLAYNREIVTGAFGVFLKELQRGAALSPGLRSSLVSGALGTLSDVDIKRFGEWYGQGAPRVLEAGILTVTDPKLEDAAFQALATKAISDPYVAKVLEFIRTAYEGNGAEFGGVVAIIALRDVVDAATIDRELGKIQGAPHMTALLKELVKGAPPEMLEVIVDRYSESMDPLDIVDLLGHPSQTVRIAAVSHLSQVNDIMLLKLISQSYEEENDPKVRAVYEQKISVIRDRAGAGA